MAFLLVAVAGCASANMKATMTALQPTVEAARADPGATVRLYQELVMQQNYDATEPLFTPEFVNEFTKRSEYSFGELQRRISWTAGTLTDYHIVAFSIDSPTTAHVDVDGFWNQMKQGKTFMLVKGPVGWQIDGSVSRNIAP